MEIFELLAAAVVGGAAVWWALHLKFRADSKIRQSQIAELEEEKISLKDELAQERSRGVELAKQLAAQQADHKNLSLRLEEQKSEMERLQEKFAKEFQLLANNIFEEKSKKFTDQNKVNISELLNPLKEKINDFEKKVEQTNRESLQWNSALREQIKGLQQLNLQMSKEAENLTKALKGDSKVRGDWGELKLEMILEKAGLIKEIHFSTQGGYKDESGKIKKPDFVIHLPDKKHLIIDSKVSLAAYEKYVNEGEKQQKAAHLKQHIEAVRENIKGLSAKNYQNLYGINVPDYVLMFIPIEPAFNAAVEHDEKIFFEALDRNIVLVTTSTLLATMRTVSFIWKQENQKKFAMDIAEQSGALYDKFVGFSEDLMDVGKKLDSSKRSYEDAMKKLTSGPGNLVRRVENIKKLGANASKSMDQRLLDRSEEE